MGSSRRAIEGRYIAGLNQPVLSLVSTDNWWIYGLFEQSKLGLVESGDEVEMIFPSILAVSSVARSTTSFGLSARVSSGQWMVTPVTRAKATCSFLR